MTWIPACAGMTKERGNDKEKHGKMTLIKEKYYV